MQSAVLRLPPDRPAAAALPALAAAAGAAAPPDLVLAFLPPGEALAPALAALGAAWPRALRLGCEAVTQFAGGAPTAAGAVHLFRFERPGHGAAALAIAATHAAPPPPARMGELTARLAGADAALLLVDGLRFPIQGLLAELRRRLGRRRGGRGPLPLAGALASQADPEEAAGARVFLGEEVFPSACLAVTLRGVALRSAVARGWDPASPVYTVTRAAGDVLHEIDGEPAAAWYRKLFAVDGRLAPMPEAGLHFPLVLEGPDPDRRGLYRTLRAFDRPPGAVTFWGDLVAGDRIRLGMRDGGSPARPAGPPAAGPPPEAALLFSCVGRERVLAGRAASELESFHGALGGVALSGFASHAEIAPGAGGGPVFHNQTAVLALLDEAAPSPDEPPSRGDR
jgi:small ligand-binding sensory domain FIST